MFKFFSPVWLSRTHSHLVLELYQPHFPLSSWFFLYIFGSHSQIWSLIMLGLLGLLLCFAHVLAFPFSAACWIVEDMSVLLVLYSFTYFLNFSYTSAFMYLPLTLWRVLSVIWLDSFLLFNKWNNFSTIFFNLIFVRVYFHLQKRLYRHWHSFSKVSLTVFCFEFLSEEIVLSETFMMIVFIFVFLDLWIYTFVWQLLLLYW